MLALIGNLDILELIVIAAVAVIVFGKRLPEVAMRGAAQVMRLRREVAKMWREAGLEDELRKVRHELEHAVPTDISAQALIEAAEREADKQREGALGISPHDVGALDPLSREALEGEPGSEFEHEHYGHHHEQPGDEDSMEDLAEEYSADPSMQEQQLPWGGEPGDGEPGDEEAHGAVVAEEPADPTLQARTEPTGEDDLLDDEDDAEEKESA
ncbi:MAG: twin-arginine translocase TatA/TatE family subunit [Planctomycetota bacterium]|nr:twin-arginine translocase TatA/TatE family subunit [Planctomycetota bacterium]